MHVCACARECVGARGRECGGSRWREQSRKKGGRCKVGWATIGVEQPFLSTIVLGFWGEARWREQIAKEVAIARSDGRRLVLSNQVWAPLCSVSLWCRVCGMRVKSRKDRQCEVWVWEQGPPPGRPPKAQGVVRELADLRPKVRQVQLHSWGCILQWSGAMGGGSQVRHPLHKHPVGGSSQAGHLLRNPALDDSIGGS